MNIYRNNSYYYHEDRYYLNDSGVYTVVPALRGIRINVLPTVHQTIIVNQVYYYYTEENFYTKDSSG